MMMSISSRSKGDDQSVVHTEFPTELCIEGNENVATSQRYVNIQWSESGSVTVTVTVTVAVTVAVTVTVTVGGWSSSDI